MADKESTQCSSNLSNDIREVLYRDQARRELSSIDTPTIQVRWQLGTLWTRKYQLTKLTVWVRVGESTQNGLVYLLSNTIFPAVRHCWRWMRPSNPVEYKSNYAKKSNKNMRTARTLGSSGLWRVWLGSRDRLIRRHAKSKTGVNTSTTPLSDCSTMKSSSNHAIAQIVFLLYGFLKLNSRAGIFMTG